MSIENYLEIFENILPLDKIDENLCKLIKSLANNINELAVIIFKLLTKSIDLTYHS